MRALAAIRRALNKTAPRPAKLPRFQSYRGFLFGSLKADVQPLEAYLGKPARLST